MMKPRCGHRADDVERGMVFAWRMRDASTIRLGLAFLMTLGVFLGVASTSEFLFEARSLNAMAPRSDAVRVLPWSEVEGTELEGFLSQKSPVRDTSFQMSLATNIDGWLQQLGADLEERQPTVQFFEMPETGGQDEVELDVGPEWTLPEVPEATWQAPVFEKAIWRFVVAEGGLGKRIERKSYPWLDEQVPPVKRVILNLALDENGEILLAAPLVSEVEISATLRKWLASVEFSTGEREAGLLEIEFERGWK